MTELRRCRLCGEEPCRVDDYAGHPEDPNRGHYEIGCPDDCGVYVWAPTLEEAERKWNLLMGRAVRPDDAPRKAIEIRITLSCHTWDEVAGELPRETARVLEQREQAGHVYACGYGPSGSIDVFTREVTAEQHAEELEEWLEAERAPKEADAPPTPRPLEEWDEDDGAVLWWALPVREPPYVGSPLDDDFPGHFVTHWTPLVCPEVPRG